MACMCKYGRAFNFDAGITLKASNYTYADIKSTPLEQALNVYSGVRRLTSILAG